MQKPPEILAREVEKTVEKQQIRPLRAEVIVRQRKDFLFLFLGEPKIDLLGNELMGNGCGHGRLIMPLFVLKNTPFVRFARPHRSIYLYFDFFASFGIFPLPNQQ